VKRRVVSQTTVDRLLGRVPTVFIAVALAALAALAFGATAVSLDAGADQFQHQVANVVRQMQAANQHANDAESEPTEMEGGIETITVTGGGPQSQCCSGFMTGASIALAGALFGGPPLALVGLGLALGLRRAEHVSVSALWRLLVLAAMSLQVGSVGASLMMTLALASELGIRSLTRPEGLVVCLPLAYAGFCALGILGWIAVAGHVLPAKSLTLRST
jgi:hypothetical protein